MSEIDDDLLTAAVEQFRDESRPFIRPPGTTAVQRSVRRRRTRTVVAATLAAVLALLVIPAVALTLRNASHRPEPGTPTPTGAPSRSSAKPAADVPADLNGTTVEVPQWPELATCSTGWVHVTAATLAPSREQRQMSIVDVKEFDVNGDGGKDAVVLLGCVNFNRQMTYQVVALTRAAPDVLRSLGQVTRTSGSESATVGDAFFGIVSVGDGGGGRIAVTVADTDSYDPTRAALTQVRVFGFEGSAFRQIAGPTTFAGDRSYANLTVTKATSVLADLGTATFTITVHNDGPHEAADVAVWVSLGSGASSPGAKNCEVKTPPADVPGGVSAVLCRLGGVAAGSTRTVTFPVRDPSQLPSQLPGPFYRLRAGNLLYGRGEVTGS